MKLSWCAAKESNLQPTDQETLTVADDSGREADPEFPFADADAIQRAQSVVAVLVRITCPARGLQRPDARPRA